MTVITSLALAMWSNDQWNPINDCEHCLPQEKLKTKTQPNPQSISDQKATRNSIWFALKINRWRKTTEKIEKIQSQFRLVIYGRQSIFQFSPKIYWQNKISILSIWMIQIKSRLRAYNINQHRNYIETTTQSLSIAFDRVIYAIWSTETATARA